MKFVDCYFIVAMFPQLQHPPALKQNGISKKTFSQKDSYALYLLCHLGDLCSCFKDWTIPVSLRGYFQHIFGRRWAETQTGFCSSSKQQKTQTNRMFFVCLNQQDFWLKTFNPFDVIKATRLKDTWRQLLVLN